MVCGDHVINNNIIHDCSRGLLMCEMAKKYGVSTSVIRTYIKNHKISYKLDIERYKKYLSNKSKGIQGNINKPVKPNSVSEVKMYKNLLVSSDVHEMVYKYCTSRGLIIKEWVSLILKQAIDDRKSDQQVCKVKKKINSFVTNEINGDIWTQPPFWKK